MPRQPGQGYVLVVVTAVGCPACEKFKVDWPAAKESITKKFPGLRVVEIVQPRTTTVYDAKYPANLNRWAVWFPSILLVQDDEWTASSKIHGASVFNGSWDASHPSGGRVVESGKQKMTEPALLAWLNARV